MARYLKIIIVMLVFQLVLTVGLFAMNLWLNFQINEFAPEEPFID
jgi:hypothetical protein